MGIDPVAIGEQRFRDAEHAGGPTADSHVDVNPLMAALAAASVLALFWFSPAGLWLLAFLGVVILVHEAGHLFVARRAGMKPTEFFWGFGPEIVAWQRGDLRIGLKVLFLGGYVKIPGMTPTEQLAAGVDEAGTYRAASHAGRMATIVAGCVVNLLCAFVAFGIAAWLEGQTLIDAAAQARSEIWFVLASTVEALGQWVASIGTYLNALIFGAEPPVRFMSPVAQAEVTGQAVSGGMVTSLRWFAILSCAIGGVNLLPLPPLDGGHALAIVIERVTQVVRRDRRFRFDLQILSPVTYATVFVLIGLSLSALVIDLRLGGVGG